MIPSFFIEKCDAKIQFFRIIGLVGIFSKNKTIQAIAKNQPISAWKLLGV